jgi:hypothetical protein|tara:strand:+ start:103 stop:594 length:492 start_codon:yes stop_codon:yes gene_type:complete
MNKESEDRLSKFLDVKSSESISEENYSPIVKQVDNVPITKEKMEKDLGADYREVRKNLKDLINTGQDAIDGILSVATDSDLPRAYEVAGQMIKTVAEMNKDLIEMHNKMKTIKKEETNLNHTTNNSIYVGSTSDLQDLINQSRSAKKAFTNDIIDVEVSEDDD